MKTFTKLTALAILIFLQSCSFDENCKQIRLSSKDISWFNFYKKHHTICFKSNYNNYDTLLIPSSITSDYTPCNKFELGDYQYEEMAVSLKFSKCHGLESNFCEATLRFSKHLQTNDKKDCLKNFEVFDLSTDMLSNLKEYEDSIQLKKFKNSLHCYTFNLSKPHTSAVKGSSSILREFSWSEEYGLVKYELSNGEIYELINWR